MRTGKLPLPDRVRLGHAAVDHVAQQLGIRILHFKGPLAAQIFPGRPAGMGDVDIYVDPARAVELARELCTRGWLPDGELSYPLSNHAIVLTEKTTFHCTFDLHVRYPGIRMSDEEAFELLWDRRQPAILCHRNVLVPNKPAHALLLLLESTRNYADHPLRHSRKIDGVIQTLTPTNWQDLQKLAHQSGAALALATTIPQITTDHDSISGTASPIWTARVAETTGLNVWLARILDEPQWNRRIRIALLALLPQAEHGVQTSTPPAKQTYLIINRWARGVRQLYHLASKMIAHHHSLDGSFFDIRGTAPSPSQQPSMVPNTSTESYPNAMPASSNATATVNSSEITSDGLPFAWLWTTGDALAVLNCHSRAITILHGPSAPLWLAHFQPGITNPISHVAQLYPDLPEDGLAQLHSAQQDLRDYGVLP